jgi:hypothetical protein
MTPFEVERLTLPKITAEMFRDPMTHYVDRKAQLRDEYVAMIAKMIANALAEALEPKVET